MKTSMFISAALVATLAAPASAAPQGGERGRQYDQREVAEAIVFSEGPLARQLSLPRPPANEARNPRSLDLQRSIMDDVMSAPNIENVMKGLESGDPWVVDESLTELSFVVTDAAGQYQEAAIEPNCGFVAVCGAVSVAALFLGAVTLVVTANVIGTLNWVTIKTMGEDDMTSQKFVADLTQTLDGSIADS